MKRFIFLAEAETEMLDASAFYKRQQKVLSKRFLTAVQEALTRIRINPTVYPFLERDIRRCLLRGFPYAIIFRMLGGTVVVVSVMHLSRDPEYWKNRH